MPCPPLERIRNKKHVRLAVLLGALAVPGCSNSGQGTIQVDPSARHLGTDPVTKPRRDLANTKTKADPGPVATRQASPRSRPDGEVSRLGSVRVSDFVSFLPV